MTRLSLVFVGLGLTVVTAVASAQNYANPQSYPSPQAYGGYGPGMSPAAQYAQMPYPQAGYPSGQNATMYGAPQNPQAQYEAAQAIYYQRQMASQAAPTSPPPRAKLPRGVRDENGLLFYDGRPYGETSYQQMQSMNPYQQVAYQQSMPGGMGSGGTPSVMSPSSSNGPSGGYAQDGPMSGGGQVMQDDGGQGCNGENCGGDCNGGSGGESCWLFHHPLFPGKDGYVWSGGYDSLLMTRSAGSDRIMTQNLDTLGTVFDSHQMHFDPSYGGRTFIQLMGPSGIAYQAVYMKLATLVADASVTGPDDLQIPFPLAASTTDFFGANQMLFHYTSAIQGGEVNMLYPWGSFQFIAGFRYMEIDESFKLTAVNEITAGTSDFTGDAFNQMFGGQVGIQSQWSLFDLVNFDFMAKFAVFGDRSQEHQVLYDLDNTVTVRDTSGKNASTAYLGELAVQGVVPLSPSFSFHAGYSVMFINQVALAADQSDFNDQLNSGTHVDTRGDIILHGLNIGLTAVW